MTSIALGPLALPTGPLLLLLAALAATWLGDRLTPADETGTPPQRAGGTLWTALLVALLAARAVHVGLNLGAYGPQPWAILDVRDGGWHAPAGLVAGIAWVAWQAWRRAAWRSALAAGAAAGCAIWGAGLTVLVLLAPPKELPDLMLADLTSGQPVRLREVAAGRPVVLNLWATWCGPCRAEMPVLAQAQAQRPDVAFVFVNQGEAPPLVRRYLEGERLQLAHVLLDPARQAAGAVASRGLPTTVFYDAAGRRFDAHLGALNAAALAAKLPPPAAAASRPSP